MKISAFTNNHLELQGRIANAREYSEGKAANITIAVDNGTGEDGAQKDPSFIQLKSFTPATYNQLKQGMLVRVYGHITTGNYPKDGKTVYTTDLVADYIEFLESKAVIEAREAMKNAEKT